MVSASDRDLVANEKAEVRNTFQFVPDKLASTLPNRGPAVVSLHKDA
jgi:hypothetical protein